MYVWSSVSSVSRPTRLQDLGDLGRESSARAEVRLPLRLGPRPAGPEAGVEGVGELTHPLSMYKGRVCTCLPPTHTNTKQVSLDARLAGSCWKRTLGEDRLPCLTMLDRCARLESPPLAESGHHKSSSIRPAP